MATATAVLGALLARRGPDMQAYEAVADALGWRALARDTDQDMADTRVRDTLRRAGDAAQLVAQAQRLRWPPRDADAALQLAAAGGAWVEIANGDRETSAEVAAQVVKNASLWRAIAALPPA